jgi:hypothetical protein
MVEQQHQIGSAIVPIRGVVRAMCKRTARARAAEGCRQANEYLAAQHGIEPAKPTGKAYALYPIG